MNLNVIKKIEVFGDSILKGIQLNTLSRRYQVDNNIDIPEISRQHSVAIENFSKFGCTITKGFMLLQRRFAAGTDCDAVVMDFGGNDCDFNWREIAENPDGEFEPKTPLEVFADTYRKMIAFLRERGVTAILTTLPPIDPQRFFDWFCDGLKKDNVMRWLGSITTIYRYQENYSRTVERIAREENVPLVDLRGSFLKERRIEHLLCEDGTHPNTAGQRVITGAFLEFADKLKQSRDELRRVRPAMA